MEAVARDFVLPPPKLPAAFITQLLRKEGFKVELPKHRSYLKGGPVNMLGLERLSADDKVWIAKSVAAVRDFWYGPIVRDNYTNDTDRKSWRKKRESDPETGQEFGVYYENNKLRGNSLTKVLIAITSAADTCRFANRNGGIRTGKAKEIIRLGDQITRIIPNNYKTLPESEKNRIVSEAKKVSQDFLRLMMH